MASRIATLAVLFLAAAGIAPALAADPAGVAVSVNQNANAAGTSGSRVLSTNGSIFTGDRITTDGKGEAQLHFMDDTRMIVGPNSNIAIDKFVVTGPANAQNVTIDAAKGAFRFITGNAPKSAYTINTPVATISVRGTMFDFTSGPNGGALFIYRDTKTGGASDVTYCDTTTAKPTCFEVNDDCTLVTFPPRGGYQVVDNVYQRTQMAQAMFPFLDKNNVLPDFRVASSECEHIDPTDPGNRFSQPFINGITNDVTTPPGGSTPSSPSGGGEDQVRDQGSGGSSGSGGGGGDLGGGSSGSGGSGGSDLPGGSGGSGD